MLTAGPRNGHFGDWFGSAQAYARSGTAERVLRGLMRANGGVESYVEETPVPADRHVIAQWSNDKLRVRLERLAVVSGS